MLADPRVVDALAELEIREPAAIQEQFRLTEIPAPPFKEERRAAYFLEQLKARGLEDAYIDAEGNAIGLRKGERQRPSSSRGRPSRYCIPGGRRYHGQFP